VNGCTGKIGRSVAESIISSGLMLVPISFSGTEKRDRKLKIRDVDVTIYGSKEKETVLSSVINQFPEVIVVDYTVPDAVSGKLLFPFSLVSYLIVLDNLVTV
jgi:4-hydroxy-tetrahydrodipicolinate reductase